ncbi:MAG: putative amidohydrolase [Chlorobi bacterium]|nr:putative amidohydrolase [Chlorobiota bacterium]
MVAARLRAGHPRSKRLRVARLSIHVNGYRMRSLVLLLLLSFAATPAGAQWLLLKNARIVDPVRREIRDGAIVIDNGKISDILREAPSVFKGEVIDLAGKWVIPGLNDMHVHSFGNLAPGNQIAYLGTAEAAKIMLYAGVTGFLDLFSPEDQIFRLRDAQRANGLLAADIYCAGPILTCTGGHGTEYGMPTRVINSPAEATATVTDLAKRHPDVVKIVYDHAFTMMPTIDHATMEAAVKTASKLGIQTVIHIGTWKDAREALDAGATCITHIYGGGDIPDDLVALMAKRRAYECPTMTVESDLLNMYRNPALLDRPLLKEVVTPAIIAAYADSMVMDPRSKGFFTWQAQIGTSLFRSVKKLADGGVPLLAGTDAGNPGTFQGYSLHRELELMVKSGVSPWTALAAATTTAGDFLGRKFGVEPGSIANLVVLDGSPIDDIANTQKIAMVIYHGAVVDRQALLHPASKPWTARLIDDFSDSARSTAGTAWSRIIEEGSPSTLHMEYRNGAMHVWGKMMPKDGRPGFVGISLGLDTAITPFDVTGFAGMRIRIKSAKSRVSLNAMTTGVKNYDFHSVRIELHPDFTQLDFPFTKFRQSWSAPVPWTGRDMYGVGLWVSGFEPADYDFTIDSIEFYTAGQ